MRNVISFKNALALLSVTMWAWSAAAGTCSYTFSYFKNNPVNDFPVPVTLEEGVSGFSYAGCASDGGDLRVSDGSANLPYEIESWNPAGVSVVWVKVPSFSNATELTFKWGADAVGIDAADTTDFWGPDAMVVVHFGGETAVNSVNGDVLAGEMSPEPSVQGNGVNMIRRGVLAKTGADIQTYAGTTNQFTISFWIKTGARRAGDANDGTYLLQWGPSDGQRALLLNWNSDGVFSFYNYKNFSGVLGSDGNMKILDDNWHHFAFACNGSKLIAYRDGRQVSSISVSGFSFLVPGSGTSYFSIGGTGSGAHPFKGSLDEVRFENVCRSADFIRASVETQSRAIPGSSARVSFADYTGATISNFPVFVQLDANSGVVPESFYASLLNGTSHIRDLRTNELLPIEVEHAYFNSFDNTIGFWALMPSYSSEDGIVFSSLFDCYTPDVATVGMNPIGAAGVWNPDDYLLVFHMNPTGLLHDVVHNIKLAANCRGVSDNRLGGYPVATDGPTGPYSAYRSTTNAVQRNTGVAIDHPVTNVYTISWWMKQDVDEYVAPKKETYIFNLLSAQALKGSGYSYLGTAANRIALYNGAKDAQIDVPDAEWHHYAYAVDGTKTYCYRDGELVKTANQAINLNCPSGVSGKTVALMSSSNPVKDAFRGCGDEVRLETVCRDAAWIKACYHNQLAWRNGTPYQLVPHFAKDAAAQVEDGSMTASVSFSCRTNAAVTLYWGTEDSGKYAYYWQHAVALGTCPDGTVQAQVQLPAAGRYVCRFYAENAFGSGWSDPCWVEVLPAGRPRVYEFAVAYDGAETLKDFPLCVRIPGSVELPAEKGMVRFVDEAGRLLAWEAEEWNPAGESIAWVRVPQLVAGTRLKLEFRRNWAGVEAWPAGEVWRNGDYTGVYHLAPDSKAITRDSSAIENHITQNTLKGVATNGVVGSAYFWPGDANGTMKAIDGGMETCDFRDGFTFSGWIRRPADSTADKQAFVKHELRSQSDIGSGYYFQFWICYSGGEDGDIYFELYSKDGQFTPYGLSWGALGFSEGGTDSSSSKASSALAAIFRAHCPDNDWHHYAFTHDGMYLHAYCDGVQVNKAFWPFVLNAGILDHKLMSVGFGNNTSTYNRARGALDEYRSERVGRSAAWIKACYDNQRPGSMFVTLDKVIIPALKIILR